MKTSLRIGAFLLGLIAGGLATWFQPYQEIFVWGMDYRVVMVITTLIFSFLFKLILKPDTVEAALFIGSGAVTGLILRIIYDVFRDITAHFEWPMEVTLFALVAYASAFVGTYLGELLNWTKRGKFR